MEHERSRHVSDLDIVGLRKMGEDDKPFVVDSWLKSFRMSHYAGPIGMDNYREVYSREVNRLVDSQLTRTTVAYNSTSPVQIFGFICSESGFDFPAIHYSYVKKPFRRRGIAELLMLDAGVRAGDRFLYTYRTPIVMELMSEGAKFEYGRFDPNIARFQR